MKKLILLFGLFLSCDTKHECVTVTICGDNKTIDVFEVGEYEVSQYDGQVTFLMSGDTIRCISFTDCK